MDCILATERSTSIHREKIKQKGIAGVRTVTPIFFVYAAQLFPILRHRIRSRNSHFPRINQMALYTGGPANRVYHIVLERGRAYTLCGLKVRSTQVIRSEKPQNGVLCKHCERLSKSEPPSSVQQ